MNLTYEYSTPEVTRIHTFTLTVGHGEWKQDVPVRVREHCIGAPRRFEWANPLDMELLDALQMSSDDFLRKLTEELKRQ